MGESESRHIHIEGQKLTKGYKLVKLVDETGLTHLKRDLENLVSLYEGVMAAVAHDFRSPVTSIKGFAQEIVMKMMQLAEMNISLFSGTTADESIQELKGEMKKIAEEVTGHVEIINNTTDYLVDLAEEFLVAHQIRESQYHIEKGPLLVKQCTIDTALKSLHYLIKRSDAEFSISKHLSKLIIETDQRALTRVYINLISNAIKYGSHKTKIELGVEEQEDRYIFSVRNTGSHVSPEHMEKLFKKFYMVDTNAKGVGLGLNNVKHICELLGGIVYLHDSQPATPTEPAYTEFRFELPK